MQQDHAYASAPEGRSYPSASGPKNKWWLLVGGLGVLALAVFLALVIAAVLFFRFRDPGPAYGGQKLSYWAAAAVDRDVDVRGAALEALLALWDEGGREELLRVIKSENDNLVFRDAAAVYQMRYLEKDHDEVAGVLVPVYLDKDREPLVRASALDVARTLKAESLRPFLASVADAAPNEEMIGPSVAALLFIDRLDVKRARSIYEASEFSTGLDDAQLDEFVRAELEFSGFMQEIREEEREAKARENERLAAIAREKELQKQQARQEAERVERERAKAARMAEERRQRIADLWSRCRLLRALVPLLSPESRPQAIAMFRAHESELQRLLAEPGARKPTERELAIPQDFINAWAAANNVKVVAAEGQWSSDRLEHQTKEATARNRAAALASKLSLDYEEISKGPTLTVLWERGTVLEKGESQ